MKCWAPHFTVLLICSRYYASADDTDDVSYCRSPDLIGHQNGLWDDQWPNTQGEVRALCEGTVTLSDDGEICVDGRVTYKQIQDQLGFKNIFGPAAKTISVQGHLVSGTGNAIMADEAYYLYDFISSYTINGTNYTAGPDIVDNMLAASKGTIDQLCFTSNFTKPESYYKISHKTRPMGIFKKEDLMDANVLMAGKLHVTMEYHCEVDQPAGFVETLGILRMTLFNLSAGLSTPNFIAAIVPIFPFVGILRQLIIGSSIFSTADFPQPLEAPDMYVENIQIDAPWENVVQVMVDGVFGKMPYLMGALIKRITVTEDTIGCWKDVTEMASVDMQMPIGAAKDLDDFAVNVLFPALQELGDVSVHFGKRLPTGTDLLAAAIDKFESCGASVNLNPSPCYHPGCTRSTTITDFEFPPDYTEIP